MSTMMCPPAFEYTFNPVAETGTIWVAVRVWPAVSVFNELVHGCSEPAGYAVTNPAAGAWVIVSTTAIAVASAGTPAGRATVRTPPFGWAGARATVAGVEGPERGQRHVASTRRVRAGKNSPMTSTMMCADWFVNSDSAPSVPRLNRAALARVSPTA